MDIVDTNPEVQKPKVCRKDRFMTSAPASDENKESSKYTFFDRCSSNNSATKGTFIVIVQYTFVNISVYLVVDCSLRRYC